MALFSYAPPTTETVLISLYFYASAIFIISIGLGASLLANFAFSNIPDESKRDYVAQLTRRLIDDTGYFIFIIITL